MLLCKKKLIRFQLGRKLVHTAGEGDNVKHLTVVGGLSLIGLGCTVYVVIASYCFGVAFVCRSLHRLQSSVQHTRKPQDSWSLMISAAVWRHHKHLVCCVRLALMMSKKLKFVFMLVQSCKSWWSS
jgi:hypothetical protein